MLNWLKDDNCFSFTRTKLSFRSKRRNKSPNSSSTSSNSTLVFFDKETQKLITKSFRKLGVARSLHEQVAITNCIAFYYSCPFQEREYIQLYQAEREPLGPRSFYSVPFKEKKATPPFLANALQRANSIVESAKLVGAKRVNLLGHKTSNFFKDSDVLQRRKSELFTFNSNVKDKVNLRRRKSDILDLSSRPSNISVDNAPRSFEC